jgi:Domain of unknown function (DUF4263)
VSGFEVHAFDLLQAQAELVEFGQLLHSTTDLRERDQVLKAFDRWKNLCALFGLFHAKIRTADRIRRECTIEGFRADLAVGLSGTNAWCFVEFESAKPHCMFRQSARRVPEWSRHFEKGFSQIVDWAWAHDVYRDTGPFVDAFGSSRPNCLGVLVIGRDSELRSATARDRWEWRSKKVVVDGWIVTLLTYDELYFHFDAEIKAKLTQASQVRGQL